MGNKPNNAKAFAIQHPFLFALIFFVISFCLNCIIVITVPHMLVIAYIAQALLALGVLAWFGWLQLAGFNSPSQWRNIHLLWLPALLACFYLISAFSIPISSATVIGFALVFALLIGLNEEACYRGVILQALSPYGSFRGAILSGFFFGLSHLINFLTHLPNLIIFGQVIGGFLLGFGFAACRLRTKTIWPLVIFHAFYDLPANIALFKSTSVAVTHSNLATLSPITVLLGLVTPGFLLACYGLFLLRPQRSTIKKIDGH